MTDGTQVYGLGVDIEDGRLQFTLATEQGEVDADDYLRQQGVPTMRDRIPVLAFGANVSPSSLKSKFGKIGRPDGLVVPTVYATLPGHDVVWSGGPGVNGNFIAILYQGEETEATDVQVGINFLTPEQALVMHATELAYDLSAVEVEVAGQPVRAYYYVGVDNVYLRDGRPVAIAGVKAEGRDLPASTTGALLDELLADQATLQPIYQEYPDLADVTDSDGYIRYMRDLLVKEGGAARLALKRRMQDALAVSGHAKRTTTDTDQSQRVSWANPSTLATFGQQERGIHHNDTYLLPGQHIPAWPDADARQGVLRAVGRHLSRMRDAEPRP